MVQKNKAGAFSLRALALMQLAANDVMQTFEPPAQYSPEAQADKIQRAKEKRLRKALKKAQHLPLSDHDFAKLEVDPPEPNEALRRLAEHDKA